jgi:hypothetical protein
MRWRCDAMAVSLTARHSAMAERDALACVASALQELSCALCKGKGRVYHAPMFSLARAAGRHFMPGRDVLVADVGDV